MYRVVAKVVCALHTLSLIVLLLILIPAPCPAATYTVDDDGPADYDKIQDAINAAADGDIIQVFQGHYYENIDFRGKAITVTSTDPNDPFVVENTIIDANGDGIVVSFHMNEEPNSIISGFTITGGHAKYGAGICCWGGCSPTISYCLITYNNSDDISSGCGAGLYISSDSNLVLANCTFDNNSCKRYGGGVFCGENSFLSLTNCILNQNNAQIFYGGGIYSYYAYITLENCSITENTASDGGGIYCIGGDVTFIECCLNGNTADFGAGIFCCHRGSVSLSNCILSKNVADYSGGGISCRYNSGVRCLKLTNCILNQNISRYGNGGGIYSEDYGDLKLTNSNFTANLAEDGASIFSQSSENILIQHCTFDSNISLYSFGAAISCYESNGPATISHNIITGSEGGSGIYILYADAVIDYNNLWDNPGGDYGGWAWPGEGDISVDPNFIDPGYWDDNATPGDTTDDFWVEGNYHLHYDSSCINAGDPDYTPEPDETDIDGESRIRLGRVDMGADEAGSNPADFDENGVVDIVDYCTLSAAWQTGPADIGWNPLCNISQTTDEMINTLDLAAYCDDWLWQAWWHEQ